MTFYKNIIFKGQFIFTMCFGIFFLVYSPILAYLQNDFRFLGLLVLPAFIYIAFLPLNKITINKNGIIESGPFMNKEIKWADVRLISPIKASRHQQVFINEREIQNVFIGKVQIGVFNYKHFSVPSPLDNLSGKIIFDFRAEAWEYIKRVSLGYTD